MESAVPLVSELLLPAVLFQLSGVVAQQLLLHPYVVLLQSSSS
jgi:hypothetical protein